MKKVQKVLALLLVFMMVFTTAGMNVAAAGEMDSVAGEADIQSQEQQQTLDETDTQQEATQQETTQQTSEGILEYVYVDESVVNMPQTQNIAVGFSDENLVLESAVLHYSSVVTGEQFEMPASAIVNNTVLFTQDYPEGSAEDVYQLDSLTYQSSGVSSTVNLLDEEIDAGYTVTVQPEEENSSEEAVPDVAVYSLSEDGNVIEASADTENIEETVAGVLGEADPVSPLAREARANKTVVICAGHDATHTGAGGNGLREEELTFKVAQYCKQALEQYQGVTVYMDRDSISCKYPGQSTSYCLNQRIKDAAALGAAVFVDIHFNTGGGTGAEVYYPNKSYNEGIHQEGQNLANKILSELSALGLTNRGAKIKDGTTGETDSNGNKDDYFTTNYLSKQYGMTGVIVEHAFLDSASDAAKLKDENFLKKLGEADAAGIAATYGFSKGNNGNEQATVQIKNKNDFNGTAQIEVSGSGNGYKVAVWSEENGQDDLVWYSLPGTARVINFDIQNHKKSTGKYNVHVYNWNTTSNLCQAEFRVSGNTTSTLKVSSVDNRSDLYRVQLKFADMPDDVDVVQFPVWNKADQSDIRWITAQQKSNGVWEADVSIPDQQVGAVYQVHAYANLTSGTLVFLGKTTFKVIGPSADVEIQNYNANQGTFDVIVKNVEVPAGVESVRVPVWSEPDQGDLIWYFADRQSDGTYKVHVDIANHHNNRSTYNVHAYVTGKNGVQSCVGVTTKEVTNEQIVVSAKDTSKKESTYQVKLENQGKYDRIDDVNFAVWSVANDQDDLIWYSGNKESANVWTADVSISSHKTAGTYNVHVYGVVNGQQINLGQTTFEVSSPKGKTEVRNYNSVKGSFDVIVKNISSKSGVQSVQVPVWSQPDQSDLIWYSAKKQSDGTYKVTVELSKHQNHKGTYNIHTYITTETGIMTFTDGITYNVVSDSSDQDEEKLTTIMGETATTVEQMMRYYESSGNQYPSEALGKGGAPTLRDFCQMYYEEAVAEGVKAEVAFAQAMKESAWLKFGGIVKIEQFNFAGLGALDGNAQGQAASFSDVRTGIRAQIQHLKAYGSAEDLKSACVDPRFKYVTRNSAKYVEWLGIKENPAGVGWASDKNYGYAIVDMVKVLTSK